MEEMKAYAKVNLTLDVLRKRRDGYHDLRSVMHSIDLYDSVMVERANGISVTCDSYLPEDSATYRAARAYMALTGRGAHIHIVKRIPDEAGMGAASADAAAVLCSMHRIYGALSEERLYILGGMIGADVPFCMKQGCCLAEGIGDILMPLDRIEMTLLVVKCASGISTKALFSNLTLPVRHPDTNSALIAIRDHNVSALASSMSNALESEAIRLLPEIASIKARLIGAGALGATMTGSGSAVIGVFETDAAAAEALKLFSDCEFARICHTI